jgi:hypothetical protein
MTKNLCIAIDDMLWKNKMILKLDCKVELLGRLEIMKSNLNCITDWFI